MKERICKPIERCLQEHIVISLVELDGERWIILDNIWTDDYLSYDLSNLELWDEWVIEMSVRGEDLKRNKHNNITHYAQYWLLHLELQLVLKFHTGWILSVVWNQKTDLGQYKKQVLFWNEKKYENNWVKLFIVNKGWILYFSYNWGDLTSLNDTARLDNFKSIYIWSEEESKQWNWIINNLQILKKRD